MKKKRMFLFASILWLVSTGIWIATLCVDFYYRTTPEGLAVMHGLCVFTSLAAAVASFIRYKKAKDNHEEDNL